MGTITTFLLIKRKKLPADRFHKGILMRNV